MKNFPWVHLVAGAVAVLATAGVITVIVIAVFGIVIAVCGLEKEEPYDPSSVFLVPALLGMVYGQAFCINHGVKNQLKNKVGLAVAWYAASPLFALGCGFLVNLTIMLFCVSIFIWVLLSAVFGQIADDLQPGGLLNPIWVKLSRW